MQTFLPYPDYALSAKVLDYRRLGKQRVETLQLLNALLGPNPKKGWANHPAAKMWKGYEGSLAKYGIAICEEWTSRGYRDTCKEKIQAIIDNYGLDESDDPKWLGSEAFHASHRSNLLRKDEVFYRKYNWNEDIDLPYVWNN